MLDCCDLWWAMMFLKMFLTSASDYSTLKPIWDCPNSATQVGKLLLFATSYLRAPQEHSSSPAYRHWFRSSVQWWSHPRRQDPICGFSCLLPTCCCTKKACQNGNLPPPLGGGPEEIYIDTFTANHRIDSNWFLPIPGLHQGGVIKVKFWRTGR